HCTLREYQHSISLGASCVGRHCQLLFPRRIFLSLAEDRRQYVEGMVADEHRQFEDRAPICRGDPTISRLAFCLSGRQVGHAGRSSWIPHLCLRILVSTMTWPNALQRTAAGRRGCNRRASWPPSLYWVVRPLRVPCAEYA